MPHPKNSQAKPSQEIHPPDAPPAPAASPDEGPSVSDLTRVLSLSKELRDYVYTARKPLVLTPEFSLGEHLIRLGNQVFTAARPSDPLKCLETESAAEVASILWNAHQALFDDYRSLGVGRIDMRINGVEPFSGKVKDSFVLYRQLMWVVFVSCAVTLPPNEARERVCRHALTLMMYEVAWLQMAARRIKQGERGEIVQAAILLSIEKLPQADREWALPFLQRAAGVNWMNMEQQIKDAKAEFNLAVAELLVPLRGASPERRTALLIEGNKDLMYLPNAAKRDVQNLVRTEEEESVGDMDNLFRPDTESSTPAERDIARRFGSALRTEHFRRATNAQGRHDLALRTEWLASLPPETLTRLTPAERKIQREFAKAHRGETAALESERDLASRAACSPAAVIKFLAKLQKLEQR